MRENPEDLNLGSKSLASIIRHCVDQKNFDCVLNSTLEDKKKLYIAYGLIIRVLVKTEILQKTEFVTPSANFADRSAAATYALWENPTKTPAYIRQALQCIEDLTAAGILDPSFARRAFGPSVYQSVFAMEDGAGVLTKNLEKAAKFRDPDESASDFSHRVINIATQAAMAKLGNSDRFHNADACPVSGKIVGEPTPQPKGLSGILARFGSRNTKYAPHLKTVGEVGKQIHLGCPAVHAGVFKPLVEIAVEDLFQSTASPPTQPID